MITNENLVKAKCRKCKTDGMVPMAKSYPRETALVETECPGCTKGWHRVRLFDVYGNELKFSV